MNIHHATFHRLPGNSLPIMLLLLLSTAAVAGTQDFMIFFAAKNIRDGSTLRLDSVRISNLSRSLDTTIVGRTSLYLRTTTGMTAILPGTGEIAISGNWLNPFEDETRVLLSVSRPLPVAVFLHDLLGRVIAAADQTVEPGVHRFLISGGGLAPGAYLLSVRGGSQMRTIKMMKSGVRLPRGVTLSYEGMTGSIRAENSQPNPTGTLSGDNYRFIGYVGGHQPDTLFASPQGGETYAFSIVADRMPLLTTMAVTAITTTGAESGGTILSDGGFPITARGVCWSAHPLPTTGDDRTDEGAGGGSFTGLLNGLAPRTLYFVRAYAVNSEGVGYGDPQAFVTAQDGSGLLTDIDGNVYHSIILGTQIWTVENLNVSRCRTGDPLPEVRDAKGWNTQKRGAWCFYENNPANGAVYGRLYNYFAVVDSPYLAPEGWHVPDLDEWQVLVDYLGGDASAGDLLKEAGSAHWIGSNAGATNGSGFTGLPSGRRDVNGAFLEIGTATRFWTTLANHSNTSWIRGLQSGNSEVYYDNDDKRAGLSVRLVQN